MNLIKLKRRIRIYFAVLLCLIAFISYKVIYYWPKIVDNNHNAKKLEDEYESLLEEESVLNKEIIKLDDDDYIARYAREKYMYSKDGELIIKIDK